MKLIHCIFRLLKNETNRFILTAKTFRHQCTVYYSIRLCMVTLTRVKKGVTGNANYNCVN